jgi:pseudaminic acid biosynthesis-associated methylase
MLISTEQMEVWKGDFGKAYTDRNFCLLDEFETLYEKNYGITRSMLNKRFLHGIDRSAKVLEVGCNVGMQLMCLKRMGFHNLYGLELQEYAIRKSPARALGVEIIQGSAFNIPSRNCFFDLVFTSGVLIHVSPSELPIVLEEVHRCTKDYLWGFEYYSEVTTPVDYRGNKNLLWKADFTKLYISAFPDLTVVREERFKYLTSDNVDVMFLLKKNEGDLCV